MPRHIVILGPMGVGKTTVGSLVADALGWTLVDSDRVIEALYGRTGRDIADEEGVEQLHRIEAEVCEEALAFAPPSVIAPAASIADRAGLLDRLDQPHVVVALLTCDPEVLMGRVAAGEHRRHIDGAATRRLMLQRTRAAAPHAHVEIDVTTAPPAAAADRILEVVRPAG
jgi:shikimate kinase